MYHTLKKHLNTFYNAQLTRMVFATITAHGNSISVGLTQGFSAVILPQLSHLTPEQSSWVASLGVISTPLGALLTGPLVDFFGRKRSLQLTCLPFLMGWMLIGLAKDISWLYAGRVLTGFASGMTTSSYIYVTEISSKNLRGCLSAFGPIFVSLGILIIYIMGLLLRWQVAAIFSTSISITSFLLILLIPESQAWYASRNLEKDADKTQKWFRLKEPVSLYAPEKARIGELFQAMTSPIIYKPLCILLFFFFFQSASGIYIFLFYTINIFKKFNIDYNVNMITMLLGGFRFIMAIIGTVLLLKFRRRVLAVTSSLLMSLSVGSVAACLYFKLTHPLIPIFGLFGHIGFSMIGVLQLPWILTSELFPVRQRGMLSGLVCSIAYVFIFTSIKIYPNICQLTEIDNILWVFFITSITGSLFVYLYLPETKDKALEEISDGFQPKVKYIDTEPRMPQIQVMRF